MQEEKKGLYSTQLFPGTVVAVISQNVYIDVANYRLLKDAPNLIYLSWDDLSERRAELAELLHGEDIARAAILNAPNVLLVDLNDLRQGLFILIPGLSDEGRKKGGRSANLDEHYFLFCCILDS